MQMSSEPILRIGGLRQPASFKEHLRSLRLDIPCDLDLQHADNSPLRWPLERGGIRIDNRIAVQPMEGWDAEPDGTPSASTLRRWQRFGSSGAKLIWGGEAVAVSSEGRANPNQLVMAAHTETGIARLRCALIDEHRQRTGSEQGLVIGLQLTHSGRYCRPNCHNRGEPRILYSHPILDRRIPSNARLLSDEEIVAIISDFHAAAKLAWNMGFDFVDVKHCHGYLGHEFLSAHTRTGEYGGNFENRTRFLREVVKGIRAQVPRLKIAVRLSAFDTVPFRPDPDRAQDHKSGPGIPENYNSLTPYRWGFGVNAQNPLETDLREPIQFLSLLKELGITLVNITAGSPYYTPHIQRPALYPPSDGYEPPEDPLYEVAHLMAVTRELKQRFPEMIFVGSAYTYLQQFLPYVAQAAVREGWVDCVGIGRMVLSYPELLWDASGNQPIEHKRICRTFSDCTTGPRNGLPSGCYPLDSHYKKSEFAVRLKNAKDNTRRQLRTAEPTSGIESLFEKRKLRRKVEGIAAALLPYEPNGEVAVEPFVQHLIATHRSGLMNAVNMDTGYGNYLSDSEKRAVLGWTREALGKSVPFVAGAYIDNGAGAPADLYRQQIEGILEFGGIPILFPSKQLHGKSAREKEKVYREVCRGCGQVLAFELGPMFADCGEIFDEETVRRIMDIPEITGMKHSSLSRKLELERLVLRDRHRPDFRIYTGNDLGINMIEYGSDYLLGLATLAPEKFADRDRLWESGDAAYYEVSDALQYLGNVVFRNPVPAYKHSAAVFLHMTDRIPSDRTHPQNPQRPEWEREILRDCWRRLFPEQPGSCPNGGGPVRKELGDKVQR